METKPYITKEELDRMKEVNNKMQKLVAQIQEYLEDNFTHVYPHIPEISPYVSKVNMSFEVCDNIKLLIPLSEIEMGTWQQWLDKCHAKKMPERLLIFSNPVKVSRTDIMFAKNFVEHVQQLIFDNIQTLPIDSTEYDKLKSILNENPERIEEVSMCFNSDDSNLDVMQLEMVLDDADVISEIPYSFFYKK